MLEVMAKSTPELRRWAFNLTICLGIYVYTASHGFFICCFNNTKFYLNFMNFFDDLHAPNASWNVENLFERILGIHIHSSKRMKQIQWKDVWSNDCA